MSSADPLPTNCPLTAKVRQLLDTQIKNLHSPLLDEIQHLVDEAQRYQADLERENEELRKTRHFLEAYRARYVDLYDFAPLGYATLDQDGYLQEINLAGAKMLGADREALTGYSFREYVVEEDRQAFVEHVRQCVRERREVTAELRLVAKDGRPMAVQVRSIPIEGPKEDTLCKTAITDITERKDMEEEIRRSRAFLQTVIDAIPDTMLVIDREYRILLANRAAREMNAGNDPAGSVTCHELSHHRDLPCEGQTEPCPLRRVIATKAPTTVLHAHYDAQGTEVFVEINAAPVFDEAGEVTSIIEVCRDVTERKQGEDALARERNLLRTLIDNLPDYIYVKDAQCRFIAANLATAQIMGANSPEDLLGKTDHDFYPPELAAEYRADEKRLLHSGQPLLNKDEPHRDAEGNPRTILTTKVPLRDSQGKVVGLVGISRDITERKQVEELLRKVQQQAMEQPRHDEPKGF